MDDFKNLINWEARIRVICVGKLTDVIVLILLSWVVSGHLQGQLHLLLQITQMLQVTKTLEFIFKNEVFDFNSRFGRPICPLLPLLFGIFLTVFDNRFLFHDSFAIVDLFERVHALLELKFG